MEQIEKKQYYYVFCELTQEEYLTLEPYKKKLYPRYSMGTFLSEIFDNLPLILADDDDIKNFLECLYESESTQYYLFHLLGDHKKDIDIFTDCIINCYSLNSEELKSETLLTRNYWHFIKLCLGHKEHCNLSDLYKFSSLIGDTLKSCEKRMAVPEYFSGKASSFDSYDKIHDVLTWGNNEQNSKLDKFTKARNFIRDTPELQKKIESDDIKEIYKIIRNLKKEITGDFVYLYPITTVTDIISASLQSIFGAKCYIKKCELCGRIFVPKRCDARFCDKISYYDISKTCKEYRRTQKELERQNRNEYMKLYRSRKNSIENSTKVTKQYRAEFYEKSEYYLNLIAANKQDKENLDSVIADFIEWLNSTYIRKSYKQRKILQTIKPLSSI